MNYLPEEMLENPNYLAVVAGAAILGILFSKYGQEDPDVISIRRLMEKESNISAQENPVVKRVELTAAVGAAELGTMVYFIILVMSIVILSIYFYFSVRSIRSSTLKLLEIELQKIRHQHEGNQLEAKIQMDKSLTEYSKSEKIGISKEIDKIDRIVREGSRKIDDVVGLNVERIEKVKQGFIDVIETDDKLKMVTRRLKSLESSMTKMEDNFAIKYKKMDEDSKELNTKIHKYTDSTEVSTIELYKSIDVMKVNSYKCNIQLLNSQILFDAALSKFELVERSLKVMVGNGEEEQAENENSSSSDSQQRLEKCLSLAIETRKKLDLLHCKKENELSNSFRLSQILEGLDSTEEPSFEYFKIYSDTTDLAIADLNERLERLEEPSPSSSTDWINSWISAMYGLFNSEIINLQAQLLGDEKLKGLQLFEETGDHLNDRSIRQFSDQCKETCLKLMNSISFLVLESHMVHNDDDEMILGECSSKITGTLSVLFESFQFNELKQYERNSLVEILQHLKARLETDLNQAAMNYLTLFRQNIDDFHLIQESLKDLRIPGFEDSKENSKEDSKEDSKGDSKEDSMMSNESFIFTSSWKEDDPEEYKPLKLVRKRNSGE